MYILLLYDISNWGRDLVEDDYERQRRQISFFGVDKWGHMYISYMDGYILYTIISVRDANAQYAGFGLDIKLDNFWLSLNPNLVLPAGLPVWSFEGYAVLLVVMSTSKSQILLAPWLIAFSLTRINIITF